MKLAKKYKGRTEIIACNHSYHGSTQGAMSIFGDEKWRSAYAPLLPDITFMDFNNQKHFSQITERTACVIIEPVQAEAGIQLPKEGYLKALRKRCTEVGALLVFDENQTGFGRTGKLWALEQFDVIPDILVLGKALGGGTPMGAFISSKEIMQSIASNPILGHMTTFGGHPLCCAAGNAALQVILDEQLLDNVEEKGTYFKEQLTKHLKGNITIRQIGLMLAIELKSIDDVLIVINKVLEHPEKPLFIDWFLFADNCIRLVPPLNITKEEMDWASELISLNINEL